MFQPWRFWQNPSRVHVLPVADRSLADSSCQSPSGSGKPTDLDGKSREGSRLSLKGINVGMWSGLGALSWVGGCRQIVSVDLANPAASLASFDVRIGHGHYWVPEWETERCQRAAALKIAHASTQMLQQVTREATCLGTFFHDFPSRNGHLRT